MSPVQIIRTVAAALIAGGGALGLIPGGSCGAGWWASSTTPNDSFGWFAFEELPPSTTGACETAMAPVGSWAIALIVVGAVLLAGVWFGTQHRPKE